LGRFKRDSGGPRPSSHFMASNAKICCHVLEVQAGFHKKHIRALYKNNKKLSCSDPQCQYGLPFLWACLGPNCTVIGCGRDQNRHLLAHCLTAKKRGLHEEHCVSINLRDQMIWCYACDSEVIDTDYSQEDAAFIDKLRESLTASISTPAPAPAPRAASNAKESCGLANQGNTCYANATLQCLSHIPPLRSYFLKYVALQIKGRKETSALVFHTTQLLYDLWGGRYSSLRPLEVLREIRRFNPMFSGYSQQDSQEFLRCLLDRLHEDTKEELPRAEEASPQPNEKTATERVPSKLSTKETKKEKETKPHSNGTTNLDSTEPAPPRPPPPSYASIVSRLFQGYLLSRIKCLKCGKVSPKKDAFFDLSVPIPDDDMLDKMSRENEAEAIVSTAPKRPKPSILSRLGNWMMITSRSVTLEDCLQAFCTKEELFGADRYRCEHCKTLNNSQKFLRIVQPPEVLCIHIKRFRHDSYFGGKVSDIVQFPVRDLDISRFCEQDPDAPQLSTQYDLVSVVHHIGGISGGHYITYALNTYNQTWYKFGDSWVSSVSEGTVKGKEAYVLFYVRKLMPEKDEERKRILTLISLFQEEEEDEEEEKEEEQEQEDENEGGKAQSEKEKRDKIECEKSPAGEEEEAKMNASPRGPNPKGNQKNGLTERKKHYVCLEWFIRWKYTTYPDKINHTKYLCSHGRVKSKFSSSVANIQRHFESVPEEVWAEFMSHYGGGPPIHEHDFDECKECKLEKERLDARRTEEKKRIKQLDRSYILSGEMWYLTNSKWIKQWADFTEGKAGPPGPIDNGALLKPNGTPKPYLKSLIHYRGVPKPVWDFFVERYTQLARQRFCWQNELKDMKCSF